MPYLGIIGQEKDEMQYRFVNIFQYMIHKAICAYQELTIAAMKASCIQVTCYIVD